MDWNNDGIKDLISGDTNGSVWIFINTGTKEKPVLAEGVQVKAAGKIITQGSHKLAGPYSKLHYADWDGDGLSDLLIGQNNNIVFYKNVGKKSEPKFNDPVELTNADGSFPSRSSPYVIDWDEDGKKDMVIGTENGNIFFYRNIGTEKSPKLAEAKEIELEFREVERSYRHRLEIIDWNKDGKIDILIGDYYSIRDSENNRKSGGYIWLFLGR